jgi:hypothetical protein
MLDMFTNERGPRRGHRRPLDLHGVLICRKKIFTALQRDRGSGRGIWKKLSLLYHSNMRMLIFALGFRVRVRLRLRLSVWVYG